MRDGKIVGRGRNATNQTRNVRGAIVPARQQDIVS